MEVFLFRFRFVSSVVFLVFLSFFVLPLFYSSFYFLFCRCQVALGLFRLLVQKEIGYKSPEAGYPGLIDEAQNYMVVQVGSHLVEGCRVAVHPLR